MSEKYCSEQTGIDVEMHDDGIWSDKHGNSGVWMYHTTTVDEHDEHIENLKQEGILKDGMFISLIGHEKLRGLRKRKEERDFVEYRVDGSSFSSDGNLLGNIEVATEVEIKLTGEPKYIGEVVGVKMVEISVETVGEPMEVRL